MQNFTYFAALWLQIAGICGNNSASLLLVTAKYLPRALVSRKCCAERLGRCQCLAFEHAICAFSQCKCRHIQLIKIANAHTRVQRLSGDHNGRPIASARRTRKPQQPLFASSQYSWEPLVRTKSEHQSAAHVKTRIVEGHFI